MLHTARPPLLVALILLPLVRVVFEHTQTCPEDVVVALAISGYADGEHTLNRFITSLVQNVLETAPTRTEFDAFIWLQDNAIEQRLKSVLRRAAAEARVPVIATRGESLLALPVVYSEAETDVIGREYALLPESALLPGTFNTLRMLFKFAGVEALRAATLEAAAAKGRHRHHAYVLRIRPDLELLGRLNVVSPVLLNDAAAAAAAWSRGTAVLVPWVCPASQLLFDQLQIMRPQAAASLARLADAGSSAILANCSHPPSTYPERMVWHAMAREGVEPALAHFPETRLIGPVGVGVRDSYAKLRVDYPSCGTTAEPYPPQVSSTWYPPISTLATPVPRPTPKL